MSNLFPELDYLADDFRDETLVEEVLQDRIEARVKARPVVALEPLTGPWTCNNNLGQVVAFNPDANFTQFILKLPEWGMPQVWTLMLGLEYTKRYYPMVAPYYYFEIKAVLTVGVGGTTQEIEIDWKRGAMVSLPMNALNVRAKYSFPAGTAAFPTDLRLSAMLARGGAQKPWQSTNTRRMMPSPGAPDYVADLLSLFTEIPRLAQSVILFPENLAIAPVGNLLYSADTVIGFGGGGGASSSYMIYYITGDQLASYPNGLPVPSGAETLIVSNPAGYDQGRATAVFSIGW